MILGDTRVPCASCGRRDISLQSCSKCGSRICSFCTELHLEWDHRKTERRSNKPEDDRRSKAEDTE